MDDYDFVEYDEELDRWYLQDILGDEEMLRMDLLREDRILAAKDEWPL